MILVYNIIIFLASIILFPIFLLHPRGKIRILERYGFWNISGDYVWIHVASFGEAKSVRSLIELILNTNQKVLLTATSPSAYDAVSDLKIEFKLIPYDFFLYYKLALKNIRISKLIIVEKEFWINLIKIQKNYVKIYFISCKITNSIKKLFKIFPNIYINIFKRVNLFLLQYNSDSTFFIENGFNNYKVCGSTKYDLNNSTKIKLFNNDKLVCILGSIRKSEEKFFIDSLKNESTNFIIAPRHTEDFDYFESFLKDNNLFYELRSNITNHSKERIVLLNTLGELSKLYHPESLVFVGGSLINGFGGHSPFEAIAAGSQIFMGKYYYNQNDLVSELLQENLIKIINSKEEIISLILNYKLEQEHTKKAIIFSNNLAGASIKVFKEIFK